ncbi:MAG: MurR/RpiR family transcriptional regulator [Clostridia bacterium]|nr:MurR/RpiR family transcriptional regulator [Clostridia bacterium]
MIDLLKTIKESYSGFSKGQKKIADFILSDYDKAAFMTASKLGQAVGTSESTVVRFASELGFDGYIDFQYNLQEIIKNRLTTLQRIELSLSRTAGNDNIVRTVMQSDLSNIRQTMSGLDPEAFKGAVNMILSARKIYILGLRSSSALAGFLSYYLKLMFDNVHLVESNSLSEISEQLINISSEDVLIVISFPRYAKRAVAATEHAAKRGSGIIAVTDSPVSPITTHASHTLVAATNMVCFVDSVAAPFSLVNSLIVALGLNRKDQVCDSFETLEQLWDENQVYEKQD